MNEESFWNKDTSLEIRVEAIFSDMTDKEKEALGTYLKEDGTFHMARSARMDAKIGKSEFDLEQGKNKIEIGQHGKKPSPQRCSLCVFFGKILIVALNPTLKTNFH